MNNLGGMSEAEDGLSVLTLIMNNASIDMSIIILTWNSEHFIVRCVQSVVGSLKDGNYRGEIFIVDNGSKDNTIDLIHQLRYVYPEYIIPIYLNSNYGTTTTRNIALKKSRGNFLCIMDSDVEVTQNIFSELTSFLERDMSVGIAVPQILYPSGNWQKSFDQFPTLLHKIERFFCLRRLESSEALQHGRSDENRDIDYAISAFWLFRREILARVGLLDENIFYSPEDVDYCLRVWRAGYRIVYFPRVTIVHHAQEISRGWKLNKAKISHLHGLLYLFAKHKYFLQQPDFKSAQ